MKDSIAVRKWLDIAVEGIRFRPDREAVKAELLEHIEDKTADLQRIFPDMEEKEAQERALAGMGDAWELKSALAKLHKPWLGYLWQASRIALLALFLVYEVIFFFGLGRVEEYGGLWGRTSTEVYNPIKDGERARLGGYTFQITAAAYLEFPETGLRPEGAQREQIQLALRVSSPKFWERIDPYGVYNSLTAVAPNGTQWPMDRADIRMYESFDVYQIYCGAAVSRWGPCWREFIVYLPAEDWRPGDVAALELDSERGGIRLAVPVTEKVVVS